MTGSIQGKASPKDWKACPDRAVTFIRSLYPSKTADSVAADTGIGAETVKKWLDGTARPSWDGLWPLICAYGTPFIIACVPSPPMWAKDAQKAEEIAALRSERDRIAQKLAALEPVT